MQLSDTQLHIVLVWMQGLLNILDAWLEADSNIQAVSYALNKVYTLCAWMVPLKLLYSGAEGKRTGLPLGIKLLGSSDRVNAKSGCNI